MRAFLLVAAIALAVHVLVRVAATWLPDRAWEAFAVSIGMIALVGALWCGMSAIATQHLFVGLTWFAVLSLHVGRIANGGA